MVGGLGLDTSVSTNQIVRLKLVNYTLYAGYTSIKLVKSINLSRRESRVHHSRITKLVSQ